jgi:5-methylcytosine-specific restriction endonuclease McrA
MSLPNYSDFGAVWVEKTKSSHEHGGEGWEFGSCLWSPSADAVGHKIYEDMKAIQVGDLVLHFYEDNWFGGENTYHFCGCSTASAKCLERSDEPPQPGEWAGRGKYFRVELQNFTPLEQTIPIREFIDQNRNALVASIKEASGPFILYRDEPRLAQGKYLSSCSASLYSLLSAEIQEPLENKVSKKQTLTSENDDVVDLDMHEQFVEGQRQRRETSFFLRNRRLVKRAKQKLGTACQCCKFTFSSKYGAIGDGFIECHHLKPISEKYGQDQSSLKTNLNDVAVLCANCHRMIHRMMHKEKRWIGLEEFTKRLQSSI